MELGANQGYLNEQYKLYRINPDLVSREWRNYLEELEAKELSSISHSHVGGHNAELQRKVDILIESFRRYGHLKSEINPLNSARAPLTSLKELDINYYDFSDLNLGTYVSANGFGGNDSILLSDLISQLEFAYANSIGFEIDYITDSEKKVWLREKIEGRAIKPSKEEVQKRLKQILHAELLEDSFHKNYIGQKRFSLEGGETTIPLLAAIVEQAAKIEAKEIIFAMAHRGRLNVLHNILQKPLQEIFTEFEDKKPSAKQGAGDVKYHLGWESIYETSHGGVTLFLTPNPSHLEFAYPVIEGISRARQDFSYQRNRKKVIPLAIHGDAAFIGQGIVAETLNLSKVDAHSTGGTIHLVINNQIGFTTVPADSRSTTYCTGLAKAFEMPILHINADDVDAACWAAQLAVDYRNTFGEDIVLDLYCYRKYGHNEGDDPSFTQPKMYAEIKSKTKLSKLYQEKHQSYGLIEEQVIENITEEFSKHFNEEFAKERKVKDPVRQDNTTNSEKLKAKSIKELQTEIDIITHAPDEFTIHPKVEKILNKRREAVYSKEDLIDWGTAEVLAYASMLEEGISLRLTGQDSERGTFSHRHMVLSDNNSGKKYATHLELAKQNQVNCEVYNSILSEAAVLAFEFGYATTKNKVLTIWEAQFGDFANGAQVIIDQFIASSEVKWGQTSGITLMLPHGYEGQGPEHSSARIERFLASSSDNNWRVCYPSNSAQIFYLLREQANLFIKRPLVIFTPKSLLRLNEAACSTKDLTRSSFNTILENDFNTSTKSKIKHLVLCTGKVYYDLAKKLEESALKDVRVIRLEQIYPLPAHEIKKSIKDLKLKSATWLQEEPENMGAWPHLNDQLADLLEIDINYSCRNRSATPATGSPGFHAEEQNEIIENVLQLIKQA